MGSIQISPVTEQTRDWAVRLVTERWHSRYSVSRGRVYDTAELPAFLALEEERPLGLVTYRIEDRQCEIVTLDSLREGVGIGSALISAVRQAAMAATCTRLWLITTNDNLAALRFYQKRGFSLVAVHPNALERSRELKPEIPAVGVDGIPLRDELELEIRLEAT